MGFRNGKDMAQPHRPLGAEGIDVLHRSMIHNFSESSKAGGTKAVQAKSSAQTLKELPVVF